MSRGEALIRRLQHRRLVQAGPRMSQQFHRRRTSSTCPATAGRCSPLGQVSKLRNQSLWDARGWQNLDQTTDDRTHHAFHISDLIERLVEERYRRSGLSIRTTR
ncbi:hypothetical protein ACWGH5_39805 [Streptomyces sp. NPDC054864]